MPKHMENKDMANGRNVYNSYSEKSDSKKCSDYRTLSLILYQCQIR